jgi:hypothetical protein
MTKLLLALICTTFVFSNSIAGERHFKYKDGTTRASVNYSGEIRDGLETWYYRNGNPKTEVTYVMGKKQGIKKFFDKNGKIKKTRFYVNDRLTMSYQEAFDSSLKQCGELAKKDQESCKTILEVASEYNSKSLNKIISLLNDIKGFKQ